MNAIKTLLAVSALTAASSANAAFYQFDVSLNEPIILGGTNFGANVGIGTAILHDNTYDPYAYPYSNNSYPHVLDIWLTDTTTLFYDGINIGSATYTEHAILYGTLTGSSFAYSTGTQSGSGCTASGNVGGSLCANALGAKAFHPDVNPIAFDLSWYGGLTTFTTTHLSSAGDLQTATYTLTLAPPPYIPIPAAAWLFGSGLLGLAGVARRRAA